MDVNVNQFANCISIATYLNQFCKYSYITIAGSGVQGIGKTRAARIAATNLGGVVETVDASVLGEKELTGFLVKKPTGRTIFNKEAYEMVLEKAKKENITITDEMKLNLIKEYTTEETKAGYNLHQSLSNIQQDQEYYYNILKTTGFKVRNDGLYHLDSNGNEVIDYPDGNSVIVKKYTSIEKRRNMEYNPFTFGNELDPYDRIYLLLTHQITPIIYFIDEINKDQIILTETMNILLARNIHGYEIPWFVNCCAAMNPGGMDSEYSVRTLDPAQIDRFFYMVVHPDFNSFKTWGILDRKLPVDFISAVEELGAESANPYAESVKDTTVIQPSSRSLELAGIVYQHFDEIVSLPIFNGDIKDHSDYYLRFMLESILGYEYTGRLVSALENSKNIVRIDELISGDRSDFNPDAYARFKNKTVLGQKNFMLAFSGWLCDNITRINSYKSSSDIEENRKYINYKSQISQFLIELDNSVLNYFMDGLFQGDMKYQRIKQLDGKYKDHQTMYLYIKDFFSKEIIKAYSSVMEDTLA